MTRFLDSCRPPCWVLLSIVAVFTLIGPARSAEPSLPTYKIDDSTPPWAAAPDSGKILSDGIVSKVPPAFTGEVGASNGQWVEFAPNASTPPTPPYVLLHIDLGASRAISSLKVAYYKDSASNLPEPSGLEISYSTDKVTFGDPVKLPWPAGKEKSINIASFALKPGHDVRYAKVQIDLGEKSWVYLSELAFDTDATTQPTATP